MIELNDIDILTLSFKFASTLCCNHEGNINNLPALGKKSTTPADISLFTSIDSKDQCMSGHAIFCSGCLKEITPFSGEPYNDVFH